MTKGFTEKNIAGYLKSFYKSFDLETALKKYLDSDYICVNSKYPSKEFVPADQNHLL